MINLKHLLFSLIVNSIRRKYIYFSQFLAVNTFCDHKGASFMYVINLFIRLYDTNAEIFLKLRLITGVLCFFLEIIIYA